MLVYFFKPKKYESPLGVTNYQREVWTRKWKRADLLPPLIWTQFSITILQTCVSDLEAPHNNWL